MDFGIDIRALEARLKSFRAEGSSGRIAEAGGGDLGATAPFWVGMLPSWFAATDSFCSFESLAITLIDPAVNLLLSTLSDLSSPSSANLGERCDKLLSERSSVRSFLAKSGWNTCFGISFSECAVRERTPSFLAFSTFCGAMQNSHWVRFKEVSTFQTIHTTFYILTLAVSCLPVRLVGCELPIFKPGLQGNESEQTESGEGSTAIGLVEVEGQTGTAGASQSLL